TRGGVCPAWNDQLDLSVVSPRGKLARRRYRQAVHRNFLSGRIRVSAIFRIPDQLRHIFDGHPYHEFLRIPAMSAGVYVLAAGAEDKQRPHQEDEIYYVIRGKAKMRLGNEEHEVGEGGVIFVEKNLEHRFFDIEEEIVLLVFFAPAESA